MNDRPSLIELLQSVRQHLEDNITPLTRETNRKLYFQTLVAVNVLKISERELMLGEDHVRAEWARLDALTGEQPLPDTFNDQQNALVTRNRALCDAIRAGRYDDDPALFDHLMQTTIEKLTIANPKFLAALAEEDQAGA